MPPPPLDPEVAAKLEATAHSLLSKLFGLTSADVTLERNNTAKNNHVYIITLETPPTSDLLAKHDTPTPLIMAVPAGTTKMVLRMPKPDNNMEDAVRVRNEVALLALARQALKDVDESLIPRLYSWADSEANGQYILEEFMTGEQMEFEELEALSDDALQAVFAQLAPAVAALQRFELPSTVTGYGSFTVSDDGVVGATKNVFCTGGPYDTYRDYLKATLKWQLEQSEGVEQIKGWRHVESAPDLRKRIDAFMESGLDKVLEGVPESKKTLVHGDMTLPNFMFDKATNRVTAIVDFDFGHIGHVATECMYSYAEFGGLLTGLHEPEEGRLALLLAGFSGDAEVDPKHRRAQLWDQALKEAGALRPADIEGAEELGNVWWFGQELCYFHWLIPRAVARMPQEFIDKSLGNSIRGIQECLDHWGY